MRLAIRTGLYFLVGVIPALIPFWMLLQVAPIPVKVLVVAGVFGLFAAMVKEPDWNDQPGPLVISGLLLCGLSLTMPGLLNAANNGLFGRPPDIFSVAIVGPTLCALTYYGELLVAFLRRRRHEQEVAHGA